MINGKDQEIITINKTGNSILNNAKYSADNTDEWYTTYETIAEELSHYKNQFIDKVVLCNCDDPFESNFCYYFLRHFNQLKLKKLICTSYSGSKIDQLVNGQLTLDLLDADGNPVINNKHGYVLTITQIPGEHEEEVPDNVIKNVLQKKNVVRKLSGNGDFRSQECIEYLKECDICCTNPPFSLFSELFSLRLWEILILLYGDCTSTFMVGSTVALAGIFLTGFPPFPDVLCINKLCFI